MYIILSLLYRLALTDYQRQIFEDVVSFCYKYADQIPLTFMLGFYVSLVITRWWDMLCNIGWVDPAALHLAAYVPGNDDRARMLRRNCVRYMVLTQTLVFRNISTAVRKRFPTDDTLVTAGLMTEQEKIAFDSVISPHKKNYLPTHWSMLLLRQARLEGRIMSDIFLRDLYEKINQFRGCVGKLAQYDWVPIPLVYTQVVFLTVRCYFLIALMGRQYIRPSNDRKGELNFSSPVDLYIPILSMIQFVFYVGWMKVAEALLNPFGEDDDDFEVNYMIDRNLQVCTFATRPLTRGQ
uniref:Bestrophin homolog n=1 Tax=Plectus sambesii TaxID=2011161 RepID=A0A914WUT2_9BILA